MHQDEQIRLLRLPQVAELLGVGKSTWLRWVDEGKAPRPVRLSARTVAWRYTDLLRFIEERTD